MQDFFQLEFGLWNLWIGVILAWLSAAYLAMLSRPALQRLWDMSWYPREDGKILYGSIVVNVLIVVVSVFIPLKTGSICFHLGFLLYCFGFVVNLFALHDYGTTPPDRVITKGLYSLSRNPLYVLWAVMLLGLCVASVSMIFFILWIINNVVTHWLIQCEERYCLKTYGDSYADYMSKVPRYFLFF